MTATERILAVGTDGSPGACAAVTWAAAEAQRQQATLLLVHAYDEEWVKDPRLPPPGVLDVAVNHAEEIVADAELLARRAAPGVVVRRMIEAGDPVPVLLRHARTAVLVAVGNRGLGGFASLLLGSVGFGVATRAACPVVVVRGRTGVLDGPVVAGVDDCAVACNALDAAFAYAAGYDCPLTAVRAFERPVPAWAADISPSVLRLEERLAAEEHTLAGLLAPAQEKYPQVKVEALVSRDTPARALTEASAGARLVVVGSHGRGGAAGTLLGSVGLQLLHHAECPVMIVHG